PDVGDARSVVRLGGDRFEHGAEAVVGALLAAGHERRSVARALLAARDAHAHEADPLPAAAGLALPCVLEPRVAAVYEDVDLLEEREELLDRHVDGRPRLDHHHDAARALEGRDELLERLRPREALAGVLR